MALEAVSNQVENIPGFGVTSWIYEQYAPDHIKSKDPFYVKEGGKRRRRRAPAAASEQERRQWKQVQKKAWQYDRNFCWGGVGFDLSLGIIPIINILPVIGPILAYTLQGSLIRVCAAAGAPLSVQAKMTANCGTDFVISLCPILGVVFCWLFGCATRNAALFDSWMVGSVAAAAAAAAAPPAARGVAMPEEALRALASPYGRGPTDAQKSRTSVAQYALSAQPEPSTAPARPPPVDL